MPPGDPPAVDSAPAPVPPIVVTRVGAGYDFSDPNGPLAPYYMRTIHIVAVAVIAIIFALASYFPLWHTDVWGHMKYGQWMVEHGKIPDREPFSPWWDGRQKFTQFYTITQTVMYWVYHFGEWMAGGDDVNRMAGGVEMERALHAFLTAARFAVMLFVFFRLTKSWAFSLIGLGVVLLLEMSNVAVFRPQTFAELFVALLLLPLSREHLTRRSLILVPLLLAFWANSHGSFLVALAIMGLLFAGRCIDLLTTAGAVRPWRDERCRRLLLMLIASAVAIAVLNPYGPSFYKRTLELTQHPSLSGGISEWKPLEFKWTMGWHWVLMVSLLVAAATQLLDKKAFKAEHSVLLLAFGLGVALQERFVVWWALILPWVLVPKWASIYASMYPKKTTEPAADGPPDASFRKTLLAGLIAWALFMWSGVGVWLLQGTPTPVNQAVSPGTPWKLARQLLSPKDDKAAYLPELAGILHANYPDGHFTGSVMASPMQGDYLMWAIAPNIPVTYSHIHLFHPDYWAELGAVVQGRAGWWEIIDKYNVNLIVVEADHSTKLIEELGKSPAWKILVNETGKEVRPKQTNEETDLILDDKTRQFIAIRLFPKVPATKPTESKP